MGGIVVRKPLRERVISAVKWFGGIVGTLMVSVVGCTTGFGAAKDSLQDGLNVPGIGQVGLIQERPNTPGDVCAAAVRFESQTDKALGHLDDAIADLEPLKECADAKAQLGVVYGQQAAAAAIALGKQRRLTEQLNEAEGLLQRIVEAEGVDVVVALSEATEYVEAMKTREDPSENGPVDAAPGN